MFFDTWSGLLRVVVVAPLAYVALILFLRISGKRTLAHVPASDVATIARLQGKGAEPVGASGTITAGEPLRTWRFA